MHQIRRIIELQQQGHSIHHTLEQYYDICFRFVQCFPRTSKVVDYRKLIGGAVGFQEIWDFFGLKPLDVEVQKNCLATYSKSRNMKDYYDADAAKKSDSIVIRHNIQKSNVSRIYSKLLEIASNKKEC